MIYKQDINGEPSLVIQLKSLPSVIVETVREGYDLIEAGAWSFEQLDNDPEGDTANRVADDIRSHAAYLLYLEEREGFEEPK